jgi:hypothetical protein
VVKYNERGTYIEQECACLRVRWTKLMPRHNDVLRVGICHANVPTFSSAAEGPIDQQTCFIVSERWLEAKSEYQGMDRCEVLIIAV